ncbi:MAG: FAD-binding protein [Pseudomonadota bacterium]
MAFIPKTEADVAEIIKGTHQPLHIQGGGTRPVGDPLAAETLSLAGLSDVRLYEPGALTIVAGAGTPLAEVEAALAAENQRLAFEPMDHRGLLGTTGTPTIGGVVAANVSGPRRVQNGAARDFLLGVRFVDGTGEVLKNGGRVMKNVTGYDLVRLLAGSRGTLGAITEVAFKVLPAVDTVATLKIAGLTSDRAIAALSHALGSPYEVTGAAHAPAGPDGGPVTLIRLEGFAASVAYRTGALSAALDAYGAISVETDPDAVVALWTWVRDAEAFHGTDGDVWRISAKPTHGAEIANRLSGARLVFDWGGGLVWAEVAQGQDVRVALAGVPGHATLVRADDATRTRLGTFEPEAPAVARLSAGLRAKFDPRGILNPGLMAAA